MLVSVIVWGTPFVIGSYREYGSQEMFLGYIVVSYYIVPAIFLYGIPVSLLSDWVTKGLKKMRIILAFFIHAGFGAFFPYILAGELYKSFAIPGLICAVTFWVIDEILRRRQSKPGK